MTIELEGDAVLVVGGVRCSAAILDQLFLNPPGDVLLSIEKVSDSGRGKEHDQH